MKKQLFLIIMSGLGLGSCTKIDETMRILEENRIAIECSTQAIYENAQAIEQANNSIQENRQKIEEINVALKKASES